MYASFIHETNKYQLLIFDDKILDIFFYKSEKKFELFIHKNFFIIYKNQKLYYYQKIDDINLGDIKEYVNKNFGFKDIEITFEKDILKHTKNNHRYIKVTKSNLFKFYLIYLFLICFAFYFFENEKVKTISMDEVSQSMKNLKKQIKFKYVSKQLLDIYEKANKNKVHILSIKFAYSKFQLKIKSIKKDNIYSFAKLIKKSKIEKIEHAKNNEGFISNVSF